MDFFGAMEGGEVICVSDYLHTCATAAPPELLEPDFSVAPTLQEIEAAFRSVPKAKAHGLDRLPAELFRALPAQLAKLFCPLYAKASLTCLQPAQWRGGVLQDAYKGKGCESELASFRSLFISSIAGKSMHKITRTKLRPTVNANMHELHCGIASGKAVTVPTAAVCLTVRRLREIGLSGAVFFLDTATAYYRIIREIVLGPLIPDEQIAKIFPRFGLDGSDMRELLELIQSGGILAQLHVGEHLRCVLKDMYARSWFVTRYCSGDQVCVTKLGSRPGSTFADLIFGFVYSRILLRIRAAADAQRLYVPIAHDGTKCPWADPAAPKTHLYQALDATWADDSAALTSDPDPEALMSKAVTLAGTIIDECKQHGLCPNLRKGKSALMLSLRGKGSQGVLHNDISLATRRN